MTDDKKPEINSSINQVYSDHVTFGAQIFYPDGKIRIVPSGTYFPKNKECNCFGFVMRNNNERFNLSGSSGKCKDFPNGCDILTDAFMKMLSEKYTLGKKITAKTVLV